MTTKARPDKPLGRKAYGSIPHLIGSKRGPGDKGVNEGQHRICTERCREGDTIVIQEKIDGSNVAIAKVNGEIIPLNRAGYRAETSPYELHQMFHDWVMGDTEWYDDILNEGERLCGEWIAQAHGTRYEVTESDPFIVFDIMKDDKRLRRDAFEERAAMHCLATPRTLAVHGEAVPVHFAMNLMRLDGLSAHVGGDEPEGVIYRVERWGEFDFIAKHVRSDFVPGKYLPEVSGGEPVWNWKP